MARLSQLKFEETPKAKDVILLNRERRNHYLWSLPNVGSMDSPKQEAESKMHVQEADKYLADIKFN
jgi:hypothetical protein